jgi:hypothetical protein
MDRAVAARQKPERRIEAWPDSDVASRFDNVL